MHIDDEVEVKIFQTRHYTTNMNHEFHNVETAPDTHTVHDNDDICFNMQGIPTSRRPTDRESKTSSTDVSYISDIRSES